MSLWILFVLLPSIYAIGNPRYECGEHGRFEYCIDGFPGCIVGCHCHPGYYFDTETKICEPNAKLVEDYRRLYVAEPTRVPPFTQTPNLSHIGPTPTTTTTATEQVTRDTDDLGDWLYNQFFKTIETQVINNTDKGNVLTRRSGSSPIKKPKRLRKSKKSKSTSKKAKKKNDDLRRKLLRITEDDSLFESSFESDSGDSSSESESMSIEENPSIHFHDDKEHDQRKLIIFNKKPKMPLPSFVFLPNYETPFYPPLGFPAPAPMPMYPMVPVPPMPAFPSMPCQPFAPDNNCMSTSASTADKTTTPDNSASSTIAPEKTTAPNSETTTEDGANNGGETPNPHDETNKDKDVDKKTDDEKKENDDDKKPDDETKNPENVGRNGDMNRKRKKFLQKLRERMRPPKININMSPPRKKKKKAMKNRVTDVNQEPERQYTDDYMMEPFALDEQNDKTVDEQSLPNGDDVDFKYLAQLIHRVDPKLLNSEDFIKNRMQAMEQNEDKNQPILENQPVLENQPSRRFNFNRFLPRPNEPDDSYYSNLGQQIAALIRKFDSDGHHQIDIEVDQKPIAPAHPVFNENNFASRSYWERSVRSPLQNIQEYTDEGYPQTNYRNLFNLENKVENVATTVRTFSLNDLENVVYLMDRAKSSLRRDQAKSMKGKHKSNGNLAFNLLPRLKAGVDNTRRNSVTKHHINIINNIKLKNKTNISNDSIPLNPYLHGALLNNFKHIDTHDLLLSSFGMIPIHDKLKNLNQTDIKENNAIPQVIEAILRRDYNNTPVFNHIKNTSTIDSPVADSYIMSHLNKPRNLAYQLAPMQKHSFKNTKYYHDENNHYVHEKESIPFQFSHDPRHLKPIKPSYFHHELHHFDYFE